MLAFVAVSSCTASHRVGHEPTTRSVAGCGAKLQPVAPAKVPTEVAAWAQHAPVIGAGALWTVLSAVEVRPHFQNGSWRLKFPWYLRPTGVPTITGDRIDGGGIFHAEAHQAVDASGTWVASVLLFSTSGCWEVSGRYHASTVTIWIAVS
jgi:hypothetical protein